LLEGIGQAANAIFDRNQPGEVLINFTGNPDESNEVLKMWHDKGRYRVIHLPIGHHYSGGFWERMDKTQTAIHQLKLKGENEKAQVLSTWLNKVFEFIRDLFANETLEFLFDENKQEFCIRHSCDDSKGMFALNREKLPHGYSSALNMYHSIISAFGDDIIISPTRLRGLVLIDEIESHLHVSMQKRIYPFLTGLFPAMQFIVTTHSLFVLNSAKEDTVYYMGRNETDSGLGLMGWSFTDILGGVFGVENERPDELNKAIAEYEKSYTSYKINLDNSSEEALLSKYSILKNMLKDGNLLKEALQIQMSGIGGDSSD